MGKLMKFGLLSLVVIITAGAVFLLTWEIPAPSQQVETTLPDDRFER